MTGRPAAALLLWAREEFGPPTPGEASSDAAAGRYLYGWRAGSG